LLTLKKIVDKFMF